MLVEGRFLYVALQDNDAGIDGVEVIDLVDLANPSCSGARSFAPGVPSAHNLFVHEIAGTRYLFVAVLKPTPSVHILDLTNPGAPTAVAVWPFPATTLCGPLDSNSCAPHDIFVQNVNGEELLVVASLRAGVHVVDVTNPASPTTRARFGYTWTTQDITGDGLPDYCDTLGRGTPLDYDNDGTPDTTIRNVTHDARITPDGAYLWTADEHGCDGHVIIWDLATVLADCGAGVGYCGIDGILPVGEFRLAAPPSTADATMLAPTSVHQVRFLSPSIAVLPWYEEGLRVVDFSGAAATAPIEIAHFDSVVPNTDGCAENDPGGAPGYPQCTTANGLRVLNRGFYGTWGVAWDACRFYISDRGSFDNNGSTGFVGSPGAIIALEYTQGPTPPQPLRVEKVFPNNGDLLARWGAVPLADRFNLYRGSIASLWMLRAHDHSMITEENQCDLPGPLTQVIDEFALAPLPSTPDAYYLLTKRTACGVESDFGHDSFGVPRPAGLVSCP